MTDFELLTLAAQAAGIASDGLGGCFDMEREAVWDPLTDDGDALRLAVKCGLLLDCDESSQAVIVYTDQYERMEESYGLDRYAATRRAIVRAAVASGRAMP